MKEDIKETRLENGLVVLTDRMSGVRSVTLGFFYRVGARNEPAKLNGITHFSVVTDIAVLCAVGAVLLALGSHSFSKIQL